jgi:hypothetical protein
MRKQPRVALFASQIGLIRKEEYPPMDVRDTDFILHVITTLLNHGELQSDAQKASRKKNNAHLSVYVRPEITRVSAITTIYQIFERWLTDGGEDYALKVKSFPPTEMGQKYVVSMSSDESRIANSLIASDSV